MQLIRIVETVVNLSFPDGYEIFIDGHNVVVSVGDLFEFTGTNYVVSEVKHKFLIPETKDSSSDRVHKVVIMLAQHIEEGLFYENPDGTKTKI